MTIPSPIPTPNSNKTLWAAVGVLSLVVLAMGATLIRNQSQPTATRAPESATGNTVLLSNTPHAPTASDAVTVPGTDATSAASNKASNSTQTQTDKAQSAITSIANSPRSITPTASPKRVQPQIDEPAVARAPARTASVQSICANCGTVHSVTPVERDGEGTGVGAVAGGVLGAVVGNQVGSGNGKALATILGAVGGGVAGNAVEKKMKKVIHYDVVVHMDDGSSRTMQQSSAPTVGTRVTVDGNTLRGAER